jgi:large subunit ribosomal protein L10
MSKPLKQLMMDTLRRKYEGVDSVCVVDVTGLGVGATTQFRRTLREKSMRVEVVKNTAAARAFKDTVLEPLGDSLEGPCALVTGGESAIDVAKVLAEVAKEYAALTLKQAMLDGDPSLLAVAEVAKLKGLAELLADLAGLISSPGRAIAGCVNAPQAKIAGCVKAIADKEE